MSTRSKSVGLLASMASEPGDDTASVRRAESPYGYYSQPNPFLVALSHHTGGTHTEPVSGVLLIRYTTRQHPSGRLQAIEDPICRDVLA